MPHTEAEFIKGVVDWAGLPRDGRPEFTATVSTSSALIF